MTLRIPFKSVNGISIFVYILKFKSNFIIIKIFLTHSILYIKVGQNTDWFRALTRGVNFVLSACLLPSLVKGYERSSRRD